MLKALVAQGMIPGNNLVHLEILENCRLISLTCRHIPLNKIPWVMGRKEVLAVEREEREEKQTDRGRETERRRKMERDRDTEVDRG